MLNVLLLAAAALVSLQTTDASALSPKMIAHTNLESNEIPVPRRRTLRKYVKISQAPPESVTHIAGTPLVLQCEVSGHPAPYVNWLKNGIPVTDFEEDSNEIFSSYPKSMARMHSKLVVTAPLNGDVFTCVGVSGLLEQTASTTVYVEGPSDVFLEVPSEPLITAYYKDILQLQGTSATLPCRTFSNSDSQVYWLDNKGNLVYDNPRLKVSPSGDLHISGLVFDDMGEYTCTVKNMYGKDSITTFLYPFAP